MHNKRLKLIVVLLLGLKLTGIYAQQTVTASGGNASGSGGSISFSLGQMDFTTYIGTNGSVAQGVQHSYEIFVVTGIEKPLINLLVSAYPNPTANSLTLKVDNFKFSTLYFQLHDSGGKLLQNKKIESNETNISLGNLATANYFLTVTQKNIKIKTFKIIKN